jgi:hypothetical protein
MCARHWRQVPREIQIRVNRTWREMNDQKNRNSESIQEYRAARQEAIDSIVKAPQSQMQLGEVAE